MCVCMLVCVYLPDVFLDGTLQRRGSAWERGVVSGSHVQVIIVLQQQWPVGGVELAGLVGWGDDIHVRG